MPDGDTKGSKVSDLCTNSAPEDSAFFDKIRTMCESNSIDPSIDMSPGSFAENRKKSWPHINERDMDPARVAIYDIT